MEKNITTLDRGIKRITLKINEDDFRQDIDRNLKKLRKNVRVPGFRPGKVPVSLLKKQYEDELIAEWLEKTVRKALEENDKEIDHRRYSDYVENEMIDLDWDNKKFVFVYDWLAEPQLSLNEEKIKEIPYYDVKTDKTFVDTWIEDHKFFASDIQPAPHVDTDTSEQFTFKIEGEAEPFSWDTFHITSQKNKKSAKNKTFMKLFKGKKTGETFKTTWKELRSALKDTERWIDSPVEKEYDDNTPVEITVGKIHKITPPDDKEFILRKLDEFYEEDDIPTDLKQDYDKNTPIDELKQRLGEILEYRYGKDAQIYFQDQILAGLPEWIEGELPDDFFVNYYRKVLEEGTDAEEYYRRHEKDLRTGILIDKYLHDRNIDVSNEILGVAAILELRGLMAPQFIPDTKTEVELAMKLLKENPDFYRAAFKRAKQILFLKEMEKLKEGQHTEIDAEAFLKLLNAFYNKQKEENRPTTES